ncbi:MAG TPA: polymer-forming cytoskeletal protein [Steroidobacteraceae bacterium]|jgi:cytoskeletal protein CcmA (bactofilin family)|nr:polymer-forming cytoskeletal protein [Steroidobacteraceae bacterium]
MALWKDTGSSASPAAGGTPVPANPTVTELHSKPVERIPEPPAPVEAPRRAPPAPRAAAATTESLIAADLTIEGKIAGSGDVRIAGRFKGDVQVDGNFRIDAGARLEGQVRASVVVVGGELQGNIDAAKQVDVLSTGIIVGDVKAASITVAAGSRMRGHVEFGWDDKHASDRPAAFELSKGTTRAV